MKKTLILFLILTTLCFADPQMLVLKHPEGKAIVTNWLTAHGYVYNVSSTPAGSAVIISEGCKPFFNEQAAQQNLKTINPLLLGMSLQGPPTPIVLARIAH